jgi:hypothetical protein
MLGGIPFGEMAHIDWFWTNEPRLYQLPWNQWLIDSSC